LEYENKYMNSEACEMNRKPLQVYLEEKEIDALRAIAAKKKTSMAEIVRESIAQYLTSLPIEDDPAVEIIGLGSSGLGDLSERLDDYLVDLVGKEYEGREQAPSPPQSKAPEPREDRGGRR